MSNKRSSTNKKWSLSRILGVLMIIAGLVILSLPFLTNIFLDQQMEGQLAHYQTVTAEQLDANEAKTEASFDFEAIENIDPTRTLLDASAIDPALMIGQLEIPKIDTNLVLFKGVTNDILNAGVGTMRPDQVMGEGNYPIAGHTARQRDLLLARLDELAEGDDIYLSNKKNIYHYRVYATEIVPETAIYLIEDQIAHEHGKPIVSLMNCSYNPETGANDRRLFVFGELVKITPYEEKTVQS